MLSWMRNGAALAVACGTLAGPAWAADDSAYDEYDDVYFDESEEETNADPWEHGFNRPIFAFNEWLDRWLVEPVATGWDFVMPDFAQRALRDAVDNLLTPVDLVNNLLQGKPQYAGRDIARLLVNSTVGMGGLMDPASTIGLPDSQEDFGQTLAVWGASNGPYVVLPIFGPSSVRDTGGLAVDSAMTFPASWYLPFYATLAYRGVDLVNRRALVLDELAAEREAAIDFYVAVRSAYLQYREGLVKDRGDADPGSYGLVSGGRRRAKQ